MSDDCLIKNFSIQRVNCTFLITSSVHSIVYFRNVVYGIDSSLIYFITLAFYLTFNSYLRYYKFSFKLKRGSNLIKNYSHRNILRTRYKYMNLNETNTYWRSQDIFSDTQLNFVQYFPTEFDVVGKFQHNII